MSFDRLQEKIDILKNPTIVGLDPAVEHIPPFIIKKHIDEKGETLKAIAAAYLEFNYGLIDALCDIIPAVKPQSAYYELLGYEGVKTLKETCDYAKEKGLFVVCDAKRNDIGSTAAAYSEAYLGSVCVGNTELVPFGADALTVNAYLGSDGIKPFINTAERCDKAVFALVKTSNPSSGELQDRYIGEDRFYAVVGDLMENISAHTVGKYGFTRVGAVVGATYPEQLQTLRKRLGRTFFLVPGYGAQGGTAKDAANAFLENGHGAIINSSRAIMAAWKKTGEDGADYAQAACDEVLRMRSELRQEIYR